MTALIADLRAAAPHRRARRRLVRGLLAVAVAAATFTGLATATSAAASTGGDESGFVASVNAARRSAGRPTYDVSSDLTSVARRWAQTMASSGSLRHNPNLAGQVSGWRFVGENVGVGYDVGGLHRAFMASPAHRANVLDSDFTQVGIGVAYGGGRLWVAEVFRKPTATAAASAIRRPSRSTSRSTATVYSVGSRGTVVTAIQHRVGVQADGRYGRRTATGVMRWQRSHHQPVTGVVTPGVRRAMRV